MNKIQRRSCNAWKTLRRRGVLANDRIGSHDRYHTRNVKAKQLDEGIADTLV